MKGFRIYEPCMLTTGARQALTLRCWILLLTLLILKKEEMMDGEIKSFPFENQGQMDFIRVISVQPD